MPKTIWKNAIYSFKKPQNKNEKNNPQCENEMGYIIDEP